VFHLLSEIIKKEKSPFRSVCPEQSVQGWQRRIVPSCASTGVLPLLAFDCRSWGSYSSTSTAPGESRPLEIVAAKERENSGHRTEDKWEDTVSKTWKMCFLSIVTSAGSFQTRHLARKTVCGTMLWNLA